MRQLQNIWQPLAMLLICDQDVFTIFAASLINIIGTIHSVGVELRYIAACTGYHLLHAKWSLHNSKVLTAIITVPASKPTT